MASLKSVFGFLLPWEFSPAMLVLCLGGAMLYTRGLRTPGHGRGEHLARRLAFYIGCGLIYFVTQTRFDYLSQHMFFIHRLQHLVLHHLGPFLVAIARPGPVLLRALPAEFAKRTLAPLARHPVFRYAYRTVQNPLVAPVLFVGLIFFWLTPDIHFNAMLSDRLYWIMNWSMLLDGLLFWFLMLDPRSPQEGALLGYGMRMAIQCIAILPQIALGAYIALDGRLFYDVYGICGRAWDINPGTDQTMGGLITWIPASMMHVIAFLVLLGLWMHADRGLAPAPTPKSSRP